MRIDEFIVHDVNMKYSSIVASFIVIMAELLAYICELASGICSCHAVGESTVVRSGSGCHLALPHS